MSNIYSPKLWYRDDLARHPELVALDGETIPLKEAGDLPSYYPGSKVLNDKVTKFTPHGFENQDIILSVSKFQGLYAASALCDDVISIDNITKVGNQWLTGINDSDSEDAVTISFKNDPYVVTEYWIIPAFGTSENVLEERPSPKQWKLEGSNDKTHWVILDEHREEPKLWEPAKGRAFKVYDNKSYHHVRLTISKWHPTEEKLYTGLRRFWLFGRPNNSFILPNIPSPSEEFAYVVPRNIT